MEVKKKVCQWEMESDILLPQKMKPSKKFFKAHAYSVTRVRGTRPNENLRKKEFLQVPKTRDS